MNNLMVAVPTYRGEAGWGNWAKNIFSIMDPDDVFFSEASQGVCFNRNMLTAKFLKKKRYDKVLYLDDNVLPNHDAIEILLESDEPLCTGLVPRTQYPHNPVIGDICKDDVARFLIDFDWRHPFYVDWSGSGFLMVDRELIEACPRPWWAKVQHPQYMGEDLRFCKIMVEELGHRVYVDPLAQCAHAHAGYNYDMKRFRNAMRSGAVFKWDENPIYYPN